MRTFIWWVIGGLAVGGVLAAHAGMMIFRAFPVSTRGAATAAIKRRPRVAAIGGGLALWLLLYALYSLGYASTVATPGGAVARPGARTGPARLIESVARDLPPSLIATGEVPTFIDGQLVDSAAPTTAPPPNTGNPTAPEACSVQDPADAVRQVQVAAEALTGRPLGADMGAVIEALAGCKDPTNTALSLLGPVNQLLNDAGIPTLPLPDLPVLPPFFLPGEVSEPLRPTVFEACGTILRQIYTVAAVAPVARIEFDDAVAIGNYVAAICGAFAPEPPS